MSYDTIAARGRDRNVQRLGLNTIDFLFSAKRNKAAVRRFFDKAIAESSAPETVSIDKSCSNLAALSGSMSRLERETQGKPDIVLPMELEHNWEHRNSL